MDTPDETNLTPLERAQRTHDEAVRQWEASQSGHEASQSWHEASRLRREAETREMDALLAHSRTMGARLDALLARMDHRDRLERGEDGFDGY